MARSALPKNQDHRFRFAPPVLLFRAFGGRFRSPLQRQYIGQADAQHPRPTPPKKFAPAESVASAARLTRYRYHSFPLLSVEQERRTIEQGPRKVLRDFEPRTAF